MKTLNEGDVIYVKGSGKKPYEVKNSGGVVSCSCPAWRNLGGPIDVRVCKHIRAEVDRACLLPQAQEMYDNAKAKPKKGDKTAAKPAAVKKDTAPPVLLAHKWEDEDPTGWWISEKLDGVRAWWDGEQFLSRLGNVYHAPEWFKALMPRGVVLDGELFAGRGKFQETVSTVRKLVADDTEWQGIEYVVFDAPKVSGSFTERVAYLLDLQSSVGNDHFRVLDHSYCTGITYLKEALKRVEKLGGEGLMLRASGSLYEEGRSKTLLKVKSFFDDEAEVVEHVAGRGRHKGRLGALRVVWKGTEFKVGSGFTDAQRENPPEVGSKITFRYQELSKTGVPRFPTFISARDYE